MIFLSASSPSRESTYNATINRLATRDAIIAFARCCAEHDLPFYFGGQPAITALIYNTLQRDKKQYLKKRVCLYQSDYFKNEAPNENNAFNCKWIPQVNSDRDESLTQMRSRMLQEQRNTTIIIAIGGKEGVLTEVKEARRKFPNAKIYPLAGTGGAALKLYKELIEKNNSGKVNTSLLEDIMFDELFEKILAHQN